MTAQQATDVLNKAKTIWRGLSVADLRILLASITTYPTGEPETVLATLQDAYNSSDGDMLIAIKQTESKNIKMQLGL